ncbi:hypothetical protein ACFWUU_33570 [Kribbella sp. NPDC058693]|uniref:aromatic-ring hydroxylase C-terminal domain-containing protein n=1 Tax=Kribbella sp. NPDC058693 TaxID=3346602 RepID=UPI0036500BDF
MGPRLDQSPNNNHAPRPPRPSPTPSHRRPPQHPNGATYLAKKLSGTWQRYDLGDSHPLAGTSAPDLELADGTRLADHLQHGTAVLLNLTDSPHLGDLTGPWSDRLQLINTKPTTPPPATTLLIRPDGHIAWATDTNDHNGLVPALHTWLGDPA